jgi:N utilization substance protein A
VGACVGVRGVRIQAIVRELSDEKIDVIEWNPNTEEYIAKALSPARVLNVFLNKETEGMPTATVVVPEDQLSLAIGRNGQNARLAAKLTGWRIDIKGLFEATSDTLFRLHNDPLYAEYAEEEEETLPRIEAIMEKKAEGRPIQPEEYRELHHFTDRVEKKIVKELKKLDEKRQARINAAREAVPQDAYDLPIMTLGLPTRVENLLIEAGYEDVGSLTLKLLVNPDSIDNIDGIGPTYRDEIISSLEVMVGYEPLPEEYDLPEEMVLKDIAPLPIPEPEEEEEPEDEVEEEPETPAEEEEEAVEEVEKDLEEGEVEEDEVLPEGEEESLIPADAYDLPIMTLGLPPEIEKTLRDANFHNVGELASGLLANPDLLRMQEGIDPEQHEAVVSVLEEMVGLNLRGEEETSGSEQA